MLTQRKEAAHQLAERLFAAENAIDEAIHRVSDLTGHMPIARGKANLSAIVGQEAMSQAGEGLAALIEARSKLVGTHHQLALVRDQIGLRQLALGGGADKPPLQAHRAKLRVVKPAS